jgi:hypothetical protein
MGAAWAIIWPQAIALIVALLAAWVVFRLQRREEREGVLSALIAELQMHEAWVGHKGYPKGSWANTAPQWWGGVQPGKVDNVVHKLSTVATDSAIQVGPSLFMNRALVRALVNYRQRAQQLNQMIDDMAAFRATAELWLPPPYDKPERERWDQLSDRLNSLAGLVHEGSIGDLKSDGAHHHYHLVRIALRAERTSSRWRRYLWFWLGISRRANDEPEPSW